MRVVLVALGLTISMLVNASASTIADTTSNESAATANTNRSVITAQVPEGFEDLIAQSREPQYFDFWFAGENIGASFVTLEQNNLLLIDQPEAVVQWLLQVDLQDAYADAALEFLYRPVPYIAGCGEAILSTRRCKREFTQFDQPIYVTIDESALRLDIHIGPSWRHTNLAGIKKYIGDSTAGFASLNQFNGVVSGSSDTEENYNISWSSYISKGNSRFTAQVDHSSSTDTQLGSAFWQRDYKGRALRVGYVDSYMQSVFFGDQPMLLADYSTEFQTRSGFSDSRANPIFVFLSERSTIEVYRDGKLLDVANYQPGNQQLNTERLPIGTYDIELAINEGGAIRTEQHRLVKDSRLPDADERFIQFTVGQVIDNTSSDLAATDQYVARAMVRQRLGDSSAGSLGAVYDGDQSYVELSGDWIGRYLRLNAAGFHGIARTGAYLRSELRIGALSIYGDYRETTGDINQELHRSLIGSAQSSQNISVNFPLFGGTLSYRDVKRVTEGVLGERSRGVSYRRTLYSKGGHFVYASGEYTDQLSDERVALGVSYQWRPSGDNLYSWRTDYERQGDQPGAYTNNASATWLQRNTSWGDLRNQLRAQESEGNGDFGINGEVKSHWGNVYYAADQQFGDRDTTTYSTRFNWSTVVTPEGVEIGGKDVQRSSIVVKVDGGREDLFDLRVNGRVVDRVKGSTVRILNLIPYREYTVTVTPVDSIYTLSRRNQYVTLYPGNVQVLTWQATRIVALVGQLTQNGVVLANASVATQGVYGQSDSEGWFQIDISDEVAELQFDAGGQLCNADLSQLSVQQNVMFAEQLECVVAD